MTKTQPNVQVDMGDFEESVVGTLLSKPSMFLELPDQVRNAVEHLVSALALVKMIDSSDSATLGVLEELYPLVASFKRFKGGNIQALKALEESMVKKEDKGEQVEEKVSRVTHSGGILCLSTCQPPPLLTSLVSSRLEEERRPCRWW
jgi:hypothetical protein